MDEKSKLAQSTGRLKALLEAADPEDLAVLIKYNYGVEKAVPVEELIETIRLNGSHDVSRWIWGKAEYLDIVRDLAHRFKIAWTKDDSEIKLEQEILAEILQQSWRKMSDKDKQAIHDLFNSLGVDKEHLSRVLVEGTFKAFLPTVGYLVLANTARLVATAAAQDAGLLAAEAWMLEGLAAELFGPVGILAGVIILLAGLAGPAYRKLIPTVIQIAYIRQKSLAKDTKET